jgi:hypothetical protein
MKIKILNLIFLVIYSICLLCTNLAMKIKTQNTLGCKEGEFDEDDSKDCFGNELKDITPLANYKKNKEDPSSNKKDPCIESGMSRNPIVAATTPFKAI